MMTVSIADSRSPADIAISSQYWHAHEYTPFPIIDFLRARSLIG